MTGMGAAGVAMVNLPAAAPSHSSTQSKPTDRLQALRAGWQNPARSFRPHTRWWWPGSAVSKEGIRQQLETMRDAGMGGVEIISSWQWYQQGNKAYLSEPYFEMVRFVCETARRLDMDVALTFGPGWDFGGFWVPPQERSKCLTAAWLDVAGNTTYDGVLPEFQLPRPQAAAGGRRREDGTGSPAPDENAIVAVVAAKLEGNTLDGASSVVLTNRLEGNRLHWAVPGGNWRIGIFRIKYTGQPNSAQNFEPVNWCVDHFSKAAMSNYIGYLGSSLKRNLGDYFGNPIDSFFADSFEVVPLSGSLLWSNGLLQGFQQAKGYDLTPYLPAIWQDMGDLTPRIRYDVNDYLHAMGREIYYGLFTQWCRENNVQARIQPHYRFTTELIEGAGLAHRSETEVCTARFETVADPRKATASGARFYGREIVSAESYTFLHQERYRSTLEEMKIATDAYLRDGVTQLYNHGWTYTEEKEVAPSRDMPWANRIQPWSTWWRYYPHLAGYVSRCCRLLREGRLVADVLIYSPQASVWSQRVLFGNERRIMPYGNLPKTLLANGYDYDLVNDDLLQRHAKVAGGRIAIREHLCRFLILPGIRALPPATLRRVREFAVQGGVVIALDRLPSHSVGLAGREKGDAEVKETVADLFGADRRGRSFAGGGESHFLAQYRIVERQFSPQEQPYAPTPALTPEQTQLLDILRRHLAPDVALEDHRQSDGLTFIHKQAGETDIYFLTNLQPAATRQTIRFRVTSRRAERWDPLNGSTGPVLFYRSMSDGIEIPLSFAPWESAFLVFVPAPAASHVTATNLAEVREVDGDRVLGLADSNGQVEVEVLSGSKRRVLRAPVKNLPPPFELSGRWKLALEGVRAERIEKVLNRLASWTESEDSRHVSGCGSYELDFDLPAGYLRRDQELVLDLGVVGNTAEVLLNGRRAGVRWMQPYRFEVTRLVRNGPNHLRIVVTNTLQNHVAGLQDAPEVPAELQGRYGRTALDVYPTGAASLKNRDAKFSPLPLSGLLGPVRLVARRIVKL